MHRVIGILSATTLVALVACSGAPSTTSPPAGPTSSLSSSTSAAATTSASGNTTAPGAAVAPVQIANATVTPADATVTLLNPGSQQLSLSGWTLMVGSTPIALPSSATIAANQRLTLHSASGADSSTDVYLGGKAPNLSSILQPGTRIALENPNGSPVTAFTVPNA